jgi:hypothetical protein
MNVSQTLFDDLGLRPTPDSAKIADHVQLTSV